MAELPESFMGLGSFDGARGEPPYTVTDMDEAERNERERCAVVAETLVFSFEVREWIGLSKKQISEKTARAIADAIRNQ